MSCQEIRYLVGDLLSGHLCYVQYTAEENIPQHHLVFLSILVIRLPVVAFYRVCNLRKDLIIFVPRPGLLQQVDALRLDSVTTLRCLGYLLTIKTQRAVDLQRYELFFDDEVGTLRNVAASREQLGEPGSFRASSRIPTSWSSNRPAVK